MPMKNPPHIGSFIRTEVIGLGLPFDLQTRWA